MTKIPILFSSQSLMTYVLLCEWSIGHRCGHISEQVLSYITSKIHVMDLEWTFASRSSACFEMSCIGPGVFAILRTCDPVDPILTVLYRCRSPCIALLSRWYQIWLNKNFARYSKWTNGGPMCAVVIGVFSEEYLTMMMFIDISTNTKRRPLKIPDLRCHRLSLTLFWN